MYQQVSSIFGDLTIANSTTLYFGDLARHEN